MDGARTLHCARFVNDVECGYGVVGLRFRFVYKDTRETRSWQLFDRDDKMWYNV